MVVLVDKLSTTTTFQYPSDLKKTTVVVESLSTNTDNVLFQRIPAYFKIVLSVHNLPYSVIKGKCCPPVAVKVAITFYVGAKRVGGTTVVVMWGYEVTNV